MDTLLLGQPIDYNVFNGIITKLNEHDTILKSSPSSISNTDQATNLISNANVKIYTRTVDITNSTTAVNQDVVVTFGTSFGKRPVVTATVQTAASTVAADTGIVITSVTTDQVKLRCKLPDAVKDVTIHIIAIGT